MNIKPQTVVYGRSIEDAYAVITSNQLRRCELDFTPWLGIEFRDAVDECAFVLEFNDRVDIDEVALVPPPLIKEVQEHLDRLGSGERINRHPVTAVTFWHEDDRRLFEAALGFLD